MIYLCSAPVGQYLFERSSYAYVVPQFLPLVLWFWLWGPGATVFLHAQDSSNPIDSSWHHHRLGTTENRLKYTPELLEKEANLLVLEL